MVNARLKYGVCCAQVNPNGDVTIGESLGIYGEGIIDLQHKQTLDMIVSKVEERRLSFPVAVYSYYSRKIGSNLADAKHVPSNRGKPYKKSYDWYIDKNKTPHKLDDKLKIKK